MTKTPIILLLTEDQLSVLRSLLGFAANDPSDVDFADLSAILEQLHNELERKGLTDIRLPERDI